MNYYEYISLTDGSEEWKRLHIPTEQIYSSSVIPDILGVGYNSPAKRYDLITGAVPSLQETNSYLQNILEYGRQMEPIAIDLWYERHPEWAGIKAGMAKYNEVIMASCDQIAINKTTGELRLVEIKCKTTQVEMDASKVGLHWIAQCIIEMLCWRIYKCSLFIMLPDKSCYEYEIVWNEEIAKRIVDEVNTFILKVAKKQRPTRKFKDEVLMKSLSKAIKIP